MMLSCHDIAKYFLSLSDEDAGDLISNLKLQKLLYYAQGFYLAIYDMPLFSEPIEAWEHGPVVPKVYHEYKSYGREAIPEPDDINMKIYPDEVQELLDDVYSTFGQFSAWKLRNMTHEEPPWNNTKQGDIMTNSCLKEYFVTQVG